MKKSVFLLFLFLSNIIFSQEIKCSKKGDFPDGIYMTLEDVLNKKPSSTEELIYKSAVPADTTKFSEKAYFYFKKNNKRVLSPLGVSFKGELYFQTYNKYTNKKDKGYDPDAYSRFCKVTSYGRFLYFEEDMMGIWARGLLANMAYSRGNGKTRGMVIDFEMKEINIFRDCEDVNVFLKEHNLKEFECQSKRLSIEETRQIVEEINKN
jgi:hypothetical protein